MYKLILVVLAMSNVIGLTAMENEQHRKSLRLRNANGDKESRLRDVGTVDLKDKLSNIQILQSLDKNNSGCCNPERMKEVLCECWSSKTCNEIRGFFAYGLIGCGVCCCTYIPLAVGNHSDGDMEILVPFCGIGCLFWTCAALLAVDCPAGKDVTGKKGPKHINME